MIRPVCSIAANGVTTICRSGQPYGPNSRASFGSRLRAIRIALSIRRRGLPRAPHTVTATPSIRARSERSRPAANE